MDSCVAFLLFLMLAGSLCYCNTAAQNVHEFSSDSVVVEQEEVCVVGSSEVEARYCTRLLLKDISDRESFLRYVSWLRIENTNLLLKGDALGSLGTRMVIGFKDHGGDGSSDLFNEKSHGPKIRSDFLAANLGKIEQLLKDIIGGEAVGWSSVGSLGLNRDARVIQSPFKTMVILRGGASLGIEIMDLVPKSFKDFVLNISSREGNSEISTMGLWHWLPASSFNGLEKEDTWPSFFSFLGALSSDLNLEKKGPFLPNWLESRASLWGKELSSSQWQVHQRSLTLVSPQDKRQSLSLTYCESARSPSPPKCTIATHKADTSVVDYDIPSESQIQVRLHATDLSKCGTGNGENAGNWVIQDISRTLIGRGAHRMLQSTVTLSGSPGSSQRLHDGCYLRLVQSLPTGVFADQFELQGIQRRGGIKGAWIHGDKNLEQPALLSIQSIVVVDVILRTVNSSDVTAPEPLLQAVVAIPLHARYPPLAVDSHSTVHVSMPHVFMSCQQEKTNLTGTRWNEIVPGYSMGLERPGGVLDWKVPAGSPADYSFVARFTAICALTGVLVVLGASASVQRGA
ncbi:uncharacterized protein [Physcomitrium patens]|uniref:GPI transamidase component PIG-T n=2 Tax=Physcomitrium patens TaxID=3218 RepID=A0A7I4AP98_PHYPA|nr:uncharacterized protein LOC112290541 isoform X1 [Physcomitrium patens]|eukprot:XP_024392668.1 uncharacterized protein LOC112290541 isoform X1 [Physcomitrella patens]